MLDFAQRDESNWPRLAIVSKVEEWSSKSLDAVRSLSRDVILLETDREEEIERILPHKMLIKIPGTFLEAVERLIHAAPPPKTKADAEKRLKALKATDAVRSGKRKPMTRQQTRKVATTTLEKAKRKTARPR